MIDWLSGAAWANVVVLEAEGYHHDYTMYPAGSHGPCSGSLWSHEVGDGLAFHWEQVEDWGCLAAGWLAHCDDAGLLFTGHWNAGFDGELNWSVIIEDNFLTCLIDVSDPAKLEASRHVEASGPAGSVFSDVHVVTLTYPDESTEVLLGPEAGLNEAVRNLEAGIYRVTITVLPGYYGRAPFHYTGSIQVTWGSVVQLHGATWGAVKNLYR